MTDRALDPPDQNPFDQYNPDRVGPLAVPGEDADNPFAKFGPKPVSTGSATGAFGRGALRGVIPAIGSMPAIGTGAEIGAAAGALTGPLAPAAIPVGALIGGLGAGFLSSTALTHIQNWAMSKLPDSWREKIGMDDRQEQIDLGEHPTASFLGGIAPYLLTMRPGAVPTRDLPENATALQRIMAHPATARVFGGGLMGGTELIQEEAHEGHPDWTKVAIATGFGLVFNRPTKFGERLIETGAAPARAILGKEQPAGVENVRRETTEAGFTPTVAQAADAKVAGPGVTEGVFQGTEAQEPSAALTAQDAARTERAVNSEPAAPDVHDVARRMNPELFDQYDDLVRRQGEFRRWIDEYNHPPQEVIEGLDKRVADLQAAYDAHVNERGGYKAGQQARQLRAQIKEAERERAELQDRAEKFASGQAEETADLALARKHLLATEFEFRDMAPELRAAYRRAADAIGGGTVEAAPHTVPEPEITAPEPPQAVSPPVKTPTPVPGAEPGLPEPTAPPIGKPLAEQKAFIAQDVTRQLVAAGRPADEAEASGQIVAARYAARAGRMDGALGNAEELYAREGAEIRGKGDGASPAEKAGPPQPDISPDGTMTPEALREFIANGGKIGGPKVRELAQGIRQTDTPEFKQWFGDSQVKDANGDPVVVYHGSSRQFSEFKVKPAMRRDESGRAYETESAAFFFSPDKETARVYAKDRALIDQRLRGRQAARPLIRDFYISIKNPLEFTITPDVHARMIEEGYSPFYNPNGINPFAAEELHVLTGYEPETWRDVQMALDDPHVVKLLKEEGFDGARLSEEDGSEAWAAFDPRQIKSASLNIGAFDPDNPNFLYQAARGKISIAEGRKPIITLMKDANASTFLHESGHQWLEELLRDAEHPAAPNMLKDDADTVLQWLGAHSAEDVKTKHHEKFARGFEQYLREGRAPSSELAGVFAKFKQWLVQIYQTVKGLGKPINDDIRAVFDRMLSEDPERTVIAPEREHGPSMADIHEADAAHTDPHEADAGAARIEAEAARGDVEIPPRIAHEIEAERQARAAAGGTEPAAEGDALPGEEGGVGGHSGVSQPQPGSGGVRPQPGSIMGGGGKARDEGSGLSRPEQRPGGDQGRSSAAGTGERQSDRDHPLAPKPTDLFGKEESPFVDKAGNIRIENLTTSEDVARAIREAAEANDEFIGDRRGVVTDGQVMDLANDIGVPGAEDLVHSWVRGRAYNAEQVMALRKLLIDSATRVSEAMKQAAMSGADADIVAYAQARDRHHLIQRTVAGATAEAGRALRAFRDISGEVGDIDAFLKSATGKTLFQLRREVQLGAQLDTPQQVSKFMHDARTRSFGRMMLEYWVNGLISGPATHTTYMIGNEMLALLKAGPETAAAAALGRLRQIGGREGDIVRFGEVTAALRGHVEAIPAALQAAGSAFRSGTTTLLPGESGRRMLPFQYGGGGLVQPAVLDEAATYHSVMAEAFGMVRGLKDAVIAGAELAKSAGVEGSPMMGVRHSPLGAIPDIEVRGMNVLPVGTAVRLPGRFIAAIHSFFRTINYSMAKNAMAYRTAVNEGLDGTALASRVGELRQNPSPEIMGAAVHEATELTLMGQGGEFMRRLSSLTNVTVKLPIAGETQILKFIDPFVHIAGNVINQSIIRRTPIGLLSAEVRADLMGKNGTVAQDMASARMLVGTAMGVVMGSLAANGYASGSGPSDPKEAAVWRLAGNQAHSVRVGDLWYDIHRLGPLGMLLGIAADLYEVAHLVQKDEYADAVAHFHHALTQNILDESFVRGPAELIRAVEDSDRYGPQYVRNFLSSFVPFSVGMAQMARASDPYSRQARTVVDAIKNKVPGLSESLLPRRDIWGEPMPNREALLAPGVTSIWVQAMSKDPVNLALLNLGVTPGQVQRKIRNVDLMDEQYDDFTRVAGRMTKQRLDVIVRSPDWRTWPPHIQRTVIEEVIKQSREAARGVLMMKYPQIVKDATETKLEKFRD